MAQIFFPFRLNEETSKSYFDSNGGEKKVKRKMAKRLYHLITQYCLISCSFMRDIENLVKFDEMKNYKLIMTTRGSKSYTILTKLIVVSEIIKQKTEKKYSLEINVRTPTAVKVLFFKTKDFSQIVKLSSDLLFVACLGGDLKHFTNIYDETSKYQVYIKAYLKESDFECSENLLWKPKYDIISKVVYISGDIIKNPFKYSFKKKITSYHGWDVSRPIWHVLYPELLKRYIPKGNIFNTPCEEIVKKEEKGINTLLTDFGIKYERKSGYLVCSILEGSSEGLKMTPIIDSTNSFYYHYHILSNYSYSFAIFNELMKKSFDDYSELDKACAVVYNSLFYAKK